MNENWPRADCGCARCRDAGTQWWRRSGGVAQAHAQNRMLAEAVEAAFGDLSGRETPEAVYGSHSVRWEKRMSLPDFIALDADRHKDPLKQWNYRIYLKNDDRPLYLGKNGPSKGGLRKRILAHARGDGGSKQSAITTVADARQFAIAHRLAPLAGLRGDSKVLADIAQSLGPDNLDIKVGEVSRRKVGPSGKVTFVRPKKGASLLTERFQLASGLARINRRDRAEDAVADAVEDATDYLSDAYLDTGDDHV
jgi:hypothetical protein